MKRFILIIFFLFQYCISFGQTDSLNWSLLSTLPKGTEIAVGIFENGEIEKYGFEVKKNGLLIKNNSSKLFEIGSITKVFTTLSALKILNRNRIQLSQPIIQFLPNNAQNTSKEITFYKLMTHTSGIPKMPNNFFWSAIRCPSDPFLHYCENRMFRFLSKFSPKINEEFGYSNLGMGLLGYLCTKIEKSTLDTIMKKEIFQPLNMNSTTLGLSKEQYKSVVNSKGFNGEPQRTWKFSDVTKGAGNVYSNMDDMMIFLRFLMKQDTSCNLFPLLLEMEKEQIQINESQSMGLGWRIHLGNEQKIIYHGGITYGFKSLIAYNRYQKKGIVILTNSKGLSSKVNKKLKEVCFKYIEKKMNTATNI